MSLILKMQINDQSENKYIFSTENGEIELIPLSVIENGTYTPEEGQAFSTVTVAVPQTVIEQLNITANGTYEASSGHAYDVVTVNVQPILDILNETISSNGSYVFNPSQDYDGFETVQLTVRIPEPVFDDLTETITSNGVYNYTPSAGNDGFDAVQITVDVPPTTPNLQTKSLTITQNGSSVVTPDIGYDGLDEVDVNVNVPAVTPNLQTKTLTITQNGTSIVKPDTGFDGLEEVDVTVNVQGGGGGSSDVIIGTVTVRDTSGTGAKECWIPVNIPSGKAIAGILIRSKTLQVYTAPSAWYRAMVHWGMIPQNQYADKENAKCRIVAYYNSASATTLQPAFTTTGIPIASTLGTGLNDIVAFDSSKGLGLKVKATQGGNAYGFAVNTDYEYIIILVDE